MIGYFIAIGLDSAILQAGKVKSWMHIISSFIHFFVYSNPSPEERAYFKILNLKAGKIEPWKQNFKDIVISSSPDSPQSHRQQS